MSIIISMFVGALLAALILRFSGYKLLMVILASAGVGMTTTQVWVKWIQHGATSYRDMSAVLVMYALGIGVALAAVSIAYVAHRLVSRPKSLPEELTPSVPVPARTRSLRRSDPGVALLKTTPVGDIGIASASVGLLLLGGPYLSIGKMGSAPLATVDPWACVVIGMTLLMWLVVFARAWHSIALGIGVLMACLTMLPVLSGPQYFNDEPVRLTGGWLLALCGIALVISSLLSLIARMKEQHLSSGARVIRITGALIVPIAVLAVGIVTIMNWSDKARAAMHPSPRVAFAEWAEYHWQGGPRVEQKEALEAVLRARARNSSKWWSKAFPELLADADPAFRFAAMSINIGSVNNRNPWSDDVLFSLLKDPEARIKAKALHVAMSRKGKVPEDQVLIDAVEAGFTPIGTEGQSVSPRNLEEWVGRERMVRTLAELVMRMEKKGRPRASLVYEITSSNGRSEFKGTLLPEILALVIADPLPERQAGCLDLLKPDFPYNHPWRPSQEICQVIKALTTQAGELGQEAVACLESLKRRKCCQE